MISGAPYPDGKNLGYDAWMTLMLAEYFVSPSACIYLRGCMDECKAVTC